MTGRCGSGCCGLLSPSCSRSFARRCDVLPRAYKKSALSASGGVQASQSLRQSLSSNSVGHWRCPKQCWLSRNDRSHVNDAHGEGFRTPRGVRKREPPVKRADHAGRGFFAAGFRDQRLASTATLPLSGSASKACGSKSSPTHSRISPWRSWLGSARASSISS